MFPQPDENNYQKIMDNNIYNNINANILSDILIS